LETKHNMRTQVPSDIAQPSDATVNSFQNKEQVFLFAKFQVEKLVDSCLIAAINQGVHLCIKQNALLMLVP